jgi:dephospho-CoA kinase
MQKSDASPYTIVLTGGIGSGKTAISDLFRRLGATIVDTDVIARELVTQGQAAWQKIRETFGPSYLDAAGNLNRGKLRAKIFSDTDARLHLEAILHPLIAAEALDRVKTARGPYCILVIPLFTDKALWSWTDRVLVVDCDEALQIRRVMARDGIAISQARAALEAQPSRARRLAVADDVIENNGSLDDLPPRVAVLDRMYRELAAHHGGNAGAELPGATAT